MDNFIKNKYFKIWAMQFYSNFNPFSNNKYRRTDNNRNLQNDVFITTNFDENNYPIIIENSSSTSDEIVSDNNENITDIYNCDFKFYNLPKIKQDLRVITKKIVLFRIYNFYINYLPLPSDITQKYLIL